MASVEGKPNKGTTEVGMDSKAIRLGMDVELDFKAEAVVEEMEDQGNL